MVERSTPDFKSATAVLCPNDNPQGLRITGPNAWSARREDRRDDMYQREHNELFAGIRGGNPVFDGDWMAKSSLMAIMGRMACYTGRVIEWRSALESRQDLMPARLDMSAELPVPEVARNQPVARVRQIRSCPTGCPAAAREWRSLPSCAPIAADPG